MITGLLQNLFLSILIIHIQGLLLIPAGLFAITSTDLIKKYNVDAKKTLLFGILVCGYIQSLFNPANIVESVLITGEPILSAQGSLVVWGSLIALQLSLGFLEYTVSIYRKTPLTLKPKALGILGGGIIFGIFPIFFFVVGLEDKLPGIMGLCLAFGLFIVVFSFKRESLFINILMSSSQTIKMETLNKILTLCSHCKNIEDFNEEWVPIEDFFYKNSKMIFSHGICPVCLKKHYPDHHDENQI
jgi:hypothetical protein